MTPLSCFKELYSIDLTKKRYLISYSYLINNNITLRNWDKNRYYSEERVDLFVKSMRDRGCKYLDGVINVWYNGEDYFVYDGFHRFNTAKYLYEKHGCDINFECEIFTTKDENLIIQEFKRINSQMTVPDLIEEMTDIKKFKITTIADIFKKEYKYFFVKTNNPNSGNFNDTTITNFLSSLHINWDTCDIKNVYTCIIKYNNYLKETMYNNTKPTNIKRDSIKWDNKPLYIFCYDYTTVITNITNLILNSI